MDFLDAREVFDSRDVTDAILAAEQEINDDPHPDEYVQEREELEMLQDIEQQGLDAFGSEWHSGVTLVREDYFEEYAQEFVEEVGDIDTSSWITNYIDWERVARDMRIDYSCITIDGEDYWGRA